MSKTTRRLTYLDHAATSWPKPVRVTEAIAECFAGGVGNPARSGHSFSVRAERIVLSARTALARLFGAADERRMIHALNCTDALNMAIKGAVRDGDHVIITELEHNSVTRPLQRMVDEGRITLTRVPVGPSGVLDPRSIEHAMTPATRLVCVLHASNVTGVIQPVAEVGAIVRKRGAMFLVDAAQTAGVVEINAEAMAVDLLAFSGHKGLLGPAGTGGLYVGPRAALTGWREGGTGGDSIRPTQPDELPTALEAGTPNVIGLAGLTAAVSGLRPAETLAHEQALMARLIERLADVRGLHIVTGADGQNRVGVLCFNIEGMPPTDVAAVLDNSFGVAVRPGLHCAPGAHRMLGTFPDGAVRVSVGGSNTMADVDALAAALTDMTI